MNPEDYSTIEIIEPFDSVNWQNFVDLLGSLYVTINLKMFRGSATPVITDKYTRQHWNNDEIKGKEGFGTALIKNADSWHNFEFRFYDKDDDHRFIKIEIELEKKTVKLSCSLDNKTKLEDTSKKILSPFNFPKSVQIRIMNFTTSVIDRIEAILNQKGYEADRKLAEIVGRINLSLRDKNAFSGSQPVTARWPEYEKDIESRRDTFLSIIKQVVPDLNMEQRQELLPALNDLARRWLGQHITSLEKELNDLASNFGVHYLSAHNLGSDRLFASLEAELQFTLGSSRSRPESGETFIDPERLSQLRSAKTTDYDLSRLIRLCEEINVAFVQDCYHAVAMLTRAILDHIPPIFGVKSFVELANNYSGSRTFKEIAQHLDNSSRKIGDAHLHTQIRKNEVLPTRTQVDERQRVDVLLSEVIRVLTAKAQNS
jgi:hypothetical protein